MKTYEEFVKWLKSLPSWNESYSELLLQRHCIPMHGKLCKRSFARNNRGLVLVFSTGSKLYDTRAKGCERWFANVVVLLPKGTTAMQAYRYARDFKTMLMALGYWEQG